MKKDIIIIGAGDFGREVVALINRINNNSDDMYYNIIGFVDDNEMLINTNVDGVPVLGNIEWLNNYDKDVCAVCSIGVGKIRKLVINKITNPKIEYPILVDPSVIILGNIVIGEGTIICANNVISINCKIGKHSIVNLSCTLGHDDVLGDYCTINPGSNISGFVLLEDCVDIGTGTKIIQHISVKTNSIVGAGTVVVRDVMSNVTVVGNPARVIKHHNI